uniref:Ribosome biogenesis protein erb1 n=1 Tax=Anthurium amnicola TaxID=1678845 RepID=A0A1D1ZEP9_9ARAE
MWACLNKTCPCFPFRGESKPPFSHYSYDDEDNFEFESLLAGQDSESIGALLSGAPFANSRGYRRVTNMVTPNEEASASTGRVSNLLDDEDNLQTQDAQFLPDEQISKFTELISGQSKDNQEIDEQLDAEEEEVRREEEEDIERKRQAATEAAIAKGLITRDQVAANNNKNTFFTIDDDDDGQITDSSRTIYSMNLDGESSTELSTTASQRNESIDEEEQNTSLNRPRNPHERFVESEINEDDYDDTTDFEELPPTTSKDQTTVEDPLICSAAATQDEVY